MRRCISLAAGLAAALTGSVLLLSGCSGASSPSVQAPSTAPLTSDTVTARSASTNPADERAADNAQFAKSLGLETPPQVKVVREVTPDEFPTVQNKCVADAGFPADSSGNVTVPNAQAQALALAQYTCYVEYPLAAEYHDRAPLDSAQLGVVYDYYVSTLIPCLRDHGVTVDDPPSKQTYLGTVGTGDEYLPYGSYFGTGAQADALHKACPDLPADSVLYGAKD